MPNLQWRETSNIGGVVRIYHFMDFPNLLESRWQRCFRHLKIGIILQITQCARKLKKSPCQKNSWNQINQFHEILFWPKSIFCNFKNDQKSIFELGNSLKLPEMQFHEFFCLDFFKFSGPLCKEEKNQNIKLTIL